MNLRISVRISLLLSSIFVVAQWLPRLASAQVVRRAQSGAIGNVDALPVLDLSAAKLPEKGSAETKHASIYNRGGRSFVGAAKDTDVPNRVGRYQYGADYDSLPTRNADLIVIGTVSLEMPQLSEDGSNIYSIIQIKVSQVLKGQLADGSDIIRAEREGAVVKLPSGKKRLEGVIGNGFPVPGGTYLFFLKSRGSFFSILSGYTYDTATPQALDAKDDRVKATSATNLLDQVMQKIKNH